MHTRDKWGKLEEDHVCPMISVKQSVLQWTAQEIKLLHSNTKNVDHNYIKAKDYPLISGKLKKNWQTILCSAYRYTYNTVSCHHIVKHDILLENGEENTSWEKQTKTMYNHKSTIPLSNKGKSECMK